MNKQWSKEKIWSWYNARPWIRGCNYMSADCANRIDQWQELGFEERFKTTEKELELVRVVIQHFSKNTVISMVLGHPNSEITCIPPS